MKCTCADELCARRQATIALKPCTALVQASTIPQGGLGLFADKNYNKNEFVTYYSGTVFNVPIEGDRVLQINKKRWIDGGGSCVVPAAPGDFINHKRPANTKFMVSSHATCLVKIVTTRKVQKGAEFFIDYGDEYWDSPSMPTTQLQS